MKLTDYAAHDALGLAALVKSKEVTAEELLTSALEAAEALNGDLNAIVRSMETEARAAIADGVPAGQLEGVPFLLKDLTQSYAGVPTDCGSRFFKGWTRDFDSEMVARWKRAGLVVFAKTNTPEGGSSGSTEPVANGSTHNPWKLGHSPGGSSGGSAAAVAAGIAPAGHANDGGGSIRIPASACGLVGLKPSRGRTPNGPDFGELWNGIAIEHVVTRTVRDCAALLDATAGPGIGEPYYAPPPAQPFLDEVGVDPGRLRIGISTKAPTGTPVDADCVRATEAAAALLEDLGHIVEPAAPDFDVETMFDGWTKIFQANEAWAFDGYAEATGQTPSSENTEANNLHLIEAGRTLSGADLVQGIADVHATTRDFARFYEHYDIWLTPTLGTAPPPHGHLFADEDAEVFFERLMEFIPFTPIFNCTGNPAISLPLHWNADGLPIGVHFGGRMADEATLFRLAAQLEEARPWRNRRPGTSVWSLS